MVNTSSNRLAGQLLPGASGRQAAFQSVSLSVGDVLHEPGVASQYVYFPTNMIVALLHLMKNGSTAQVAMVGAEGMVGVECVLGGGASARAVVQSPGVAFRLESRVLKTALAQSGALLDAMLRYLQALMMQIAQTAACNRYHALEQQLCRWLLMSLDRHHCSEMRVTQEMIANLLGVRREGITEAARRLQAMGIIRCQRGKISILDRSGLEARACECYGEVKREHSRLLPESPPDGLTKLPSPALCAVPHRRSGVLQ